MSSCKLPNYKEPKYSKLNLNFKPTDNLDSLFESIMGELEKQKSFSIHPENSQSRSEYNDSITNLVEKIIKDIQEKNIYTGSNISELKEKLTTKLTEFEYTEVDQAIMAVIPNGDQSLITEGEREDIKFKDLVADIIGTSNEVIFNSIQRNFKQKMKISTIIGETLVTSNEEMCNNIEEFLKEQYQIIRKFLLQEYSGKEELTKLLGRSLYYDNDIRSTAYNTFQIMYNHINSLKSRKLFEDQMYQDWENIISNQQSDKISLYEAVSAYISVVYFDDFLKSVLGGYININKNLDVPINADDNTCKYTRTEGNTNAVKTWGVETRDSLKEMSKFSKVLIESIPLYDYQSKQQEFGYMQVKDFVNTISLLFNLIPKLGTFPELQNALINFKVEPYKSFRIILDEIFKNNNITLLKVLYENDFDQNYINYLYSIYKTVFDKSSKSWYKIETQYKQKTKIPNTYSIIDTILSEINANVGINYLQTSFDASEQNNQTTIKPRFNIKSNKFKVRDFVNDIMNTSKNWKESILNRYKLEGSSNFTLTIGDINILISPKGNTNILYKQKTSNLNISINNKSVDKFIPDISTKTIRHNIFNGSRTENQEKLIKVLDFLDSMLQTTFSKSEDGLNQFYLLQKINKNNFHEMLTTAVRALLVTKIYNGFENATKEDGTKYKKNELIKFLKDHGSDYLRIPWNNAEKENDIFKTIELQGRQLYVSKGIETWLTDYTKLNAILDGDTSASVISSFEGKKFPNNSPSFLGSALWYQLKQSQQEKGAASKLLFSQHPNFISEVVINSEVRTQYGVKKQISKMNISELLYDSIVNKFIIPYFNGKIYTQASVYSDKSKIVTYGINFKNIFQNDILNNQFESEVEQLMLNTIGEMYKEQWKSIERDYIKLIKFLNINTISVTTTEDKFRNTTTSIDKVALNNWLKTLTESELLNYVNQYNKKYPNDRLTFIAELHYRPYNGKLSLNELLQEYITNIYANTDNLHNILRKKKIDFANDLLKYRVKLKYNPENKTDQITRFANLALGTHVDEWLSGSTLATGRIIGTDGKIKLVNYGQVDLKEGEEFQLNPILNIYFLLDNLIGNNLRYSITGSETNHKIKELKNIKLDKSFKMHNARLKELIGEFDTLTLFDLKNAINKIDNPTIEDKQIITQYNNIIYHLSNLAQNAQYKRNVPIPGTIHPYLQKCINGISSKMKIAVIKDTPAQIFNFSGKVDNEDAHDGSAFINPIASILENWSLQSSEVGPIKKPLCHYLDPNTGTAVLLKYAVDTMTNQWMRQAEGNTNGFILRKLSEKMTNKRWNGTIDLINSCEFRPSHKIMFSRDILNFEPLYYYNGVNHVQIIDFGFENGAYYTIEQNVNNYGSKNDNEEHKVYHYFYSDEESGLLTHVTSDTIQNNEEYHTIDSLYELHTVLGGIYSESLQGNKLEYSEASNYAVARFCNYVALKKEGTDANSPVDQDHYYQPLKEMMIDVVVNQSAIKNGAANINPNERFTDNNELSYFEIGTEYYGIQLDSDHEADDAKLTEFSQVISSLDVDGLKHDYVNEVYEALGQVALELADIELNAVEQFKNDNDKTHLYQVLGRIVIDNLRKDTPGLTETILNKIDREFNLKSNHIFDRLKIPFSDPNLYSQILPTFISIINNKSIKRKYPGSGIVMVPAYNLSMIYDINGKPYQYLDVLKQAYKWAKETEFQFENQSDLYIRNKQVVDAYLNDLQSKQQSITIGMIAPTDNIYTKYLKSGGSFEEKHISLNKIEDYYKYTDTRFNLFGLDQNINSKIEGNTLTLSDQNKNEVQLIYNNGVYTINLNNYSNALLTALYEVLPQNQKITLNKDQKKNKSFSNLEQQKTWGTTSIFKDITVPRNLAPQKVFYKVNGKQTNIYQHWKLKRLFLESTDEETFKKWQKEAQEAFLEIRDGKYIDEQGTEHKVSDVDLQAAELIVSNIYQSKFGMSANDSMVEFDNQSKFIISGNKRNSTIFDLCFTGNVDTYISFLPLYGNLSCKQTKQLEVLIPSDDQSGKVVEKIYAVTSDNVKMFQIGRVIKTKGITYEQDSDGIYRYYKINDNGEKEVAKGQYKLGKDGEVLEVIYFVTKYRVKEKGKRSIGYSINKNAIKRVLEQRNYTDNELMNPKTGKKITQDEKFNSEVNNFIAHLLGNIYMNGEYNGIQVNSEISKNSRYNLSNVWNRFINQLSYDSELYKYLQNLGSLISTNTEKLSSVQLAKLLKNYNKSASRERYSSYQKSKNYIASRIPAQTLQSFMQMKCVGFTQVPNAQCFVSHWQTWLQGSDYDIDKAYIMGLNFDFNGKYIGWSNLFDYSSEKTISKSEYLPLPKGKTYKFSEDGIDISNFVDEIIKLKDSINKTDTEVERIQLIDYYIKLLHLIKNTNEVSYNGKNTDSLQKVIKIINQHERTVIPPKLREGAYKNFIASHIQNTVGSLENTIKAYSPIEMNVGRKSADFSPKTKEANSMTLLSPSTKFIMQFYNLSGKRVVGIAANGEKGSFMWNYYMNDVILHPEKYDIENAKFEFGSKRIVGRSQNNIQEVNINMLPNVNITQEWLNQHPNFKLIRITGNLDVDLMISQIVSLATDNAKELVLPKINCTDKLAKCYLFLITLGFNINDIVKFMTSPVVEFFNTITDENIFSNLKINDNQALKILSGDFSSLWDNRVIEILINNNKDVREKLLKGIIPENLDFGLYNDKTKIIDNINLIQEIKSLMKFDPNDENIKQDIEELKNVLEGANEFTSYTTLLGLNQGIKTSKDEIQKNLQNISRSIQSRCDAKSIPVPPEFKYFDPIKFADNTEYADGKFYRDELIKFYNRIKKCINIFDHIDKIPQFNAIMKIYGSVMQYDKNLSIKSKIYDSIYEIIKSQTKANISDSYLNKLVHSIDNNLIVGFFSYKQIKIPIPKDTEIFIKTGIKDSTTVEDLFSLNNINNIASFKYYMENVVIPNLQQGKYYAYENEKVIEKTDEDLKSNDFIKELIKVTNNGIPLYKCDLNMLLIQKNNNAQIKFAKYSKGIQALENFKITDSLKLSDLFVLYNLIVNKNEYGSDKMTTVIDGLLRNSNSLSIIKDYLSFVADVDYFGEIEQNGDLIKITAKTPKETIEFEINYKDNLYYCSPTVYSQKNEKDPSIILIDPKGNKHFRIKKNNSYVEENIFSSNEKSEEEDLSRIDSINKYYTLGGHLKSLNDLIIDKLNRFNYETLNTISDLILKQILQISKICE